MLWKSQAEVLLLHSIGCDDYLGSDKVVDKCGVCGGDNTGCQVVSGVFKHALTSLGYHRVVEIPQGATKINITEMYKSNNYLGKKSLSVSPSFVETNSVKVKVPQSCPTLCDPMDLTPFPSPGDLPNPEIEPRSSALQADSSPTEPQ
ncbi:hypothetical protein FD754_020500 [Muntiacus muntjak]|uniref:Uncharacterized protein n=1 Tax=Muntiacus muntjak TaxID=9888 RepID=A0A5N3V357_MUNMU|nr:hypothetical protein FD754_020500 [Muntiacus muntjak]